MKEIRKTSQFKKDYKRFKNDKEFVETLMEIGRASCRERVSSPV